MDHGDEIVDGRSNRWRTENETFTESTFNEFRSTKLIIDRSTDRSISKSFRPNRTTSQMFGMDLDTHRLEHKSHKNTVWRKNNKTYRCWTVSVIKFD